MKLTYRVGITEEQGIEVVSIYMVPPPASLLLSTLVARYNPKAAEPWLICRFPLGSEPTDVGPQYLGVMFLLGVMRLPEVPGGDTRNLNGRTFELPAGFLR